jgi:hypothetical protein
MSAPLSYTLAEAAARLGPAFTIDWLKARVKRREIPFGKTGSGNGRAGRVYFTEAHLAEILVMHEQRPDDAPQPPAGFTPVTRRRTA